MADETRTDPRGNWRELRGSVSLPPGALDAAKAVRYGNPLDTYTWDYVAEASLLAAAPLIRAAERERIRHGVLACELILRHPEDGDRVAVLTLDLERVIGAEDGSEAEGQERSDEKGPRP